MSGMIWSLDIELDFREWLLANPESPHAQEIRE